MIIPAYCNTCGLIFPSGIGGGGTITVEGNTIGCPRCRNDAAMIDGVFKIIDDLIHMIEGPEFSREILDLIQEVSQDLLHRRTTSAKARERLGRKSPEAEKNFHIWLALGVSFVSGIIVPVAIAAYEKFECRTNEPLRVIVEHEFERRVEEFYPQPDLRQTRVSGSVVSSPFPHARPGSDILNPPPHSLRPKGRTALQAPVQNQPNEQGMKDRPGGNSAGEKGMSRQVKRAMQRKGKKRR